MRSSPSISSRGFRCARTLRDRLHQVGQAFQRVVLALHRDQHAVGGAQAVQRQQRQRRRAVEQDEVVVGRHLEIAARICDSASASASLSRISRSGSRPAPPRRRRARGWPAPGRSRPDGDATRTSAIVRLAEQHLVDRVRKRALVDAGAHVALPCGSRSTSSTRRFIAARLAARLTLVVVLPTPPFWLATAMMRGHGARARP